MGRHSRRVTWVPAPSPGLSGVGVVDAMQNVQRGIVLDPQEQSCRGRGSSPPGHKAETRNLLPGPCLGRREIIQGKFRVPGSSRERNPGPGGETEAHDGRLGCESPRPTADGEPRRHPLWFGPRRVRGWRGAALETPHRYVLGVTPELPRAGPAWTWPGTPAPWP